MYLNHASIFERCKDVDVACFIETFLEDDTSGHLRIPNDSHALFIPGKRGPHSRRASGGFALLIKNRVARPVNCSFVERANGVCVADLRLENQAEISLVIAYRAEKAGTPLHNPTFFADLDAAIASRDDRETLVLGDFNTKLGDRQGPLGLLDFAEDLLPAVAESTDVDQHAEELFEVFSSAQLYAFHDVQNGVVYDTFECRDGSGGGSLIDFILSNSLMYPRVLSVVSNFHLESNHAMLRVHLEYDTDFTSTSSVGRPPGRVRMFNLERLLDLEHTEAIKALAGRPHDFTVRSAFEAILDFVDQFTEVVTVQTRPQTPYVSSETINARRQARRIERRLKVERDTEIRRALRAEWILACDRWRSCRDYDIKVTVEDAKKKFYDAVSSKDLYRAWKIARRNLAGKGGGIRDSVTAFIDQDGWESHFSSLFAGTGTQLRAPVAGLTSRILDDPFTAEEVATILESKKNHRAVGPDGFNLDHIRILRYDETTARALANFLNICVQQAEVPDEWGRAFLFILYKGSGPKDNANSFRGITLKSQLLKLLESLLCNRLRQWAETNRLLPAEQIAYRPGHNGTDHLFSLCLIRDRARASGQSLFTSFVDLRKAFPSVDRQRLLHHLSSLGVSDYFLRILTRLYTGDSFQILLDGQASSRSFQVHTGVHEGSPLSPLLFILFIAGLVRHLRENGGDRLGFRLRGATVCCLLYADDVLLLATTRGGLQRLLDLTCIFFENLGMTINPLKSDVVIFAPLRSPNPTTFNIAGLNKAIVDESKYLGVIFHKGGNWKCQLETVLTRCKMARGRCNIICSSLGIDKPKAMCQIFDMFVSAIYRYSLGSWGVTASGLHRIDNLFCDFIRRQYRLPASTCRRGILMQFGRRCAACDARYLASVQIARGLTCPDSVWNNVLDTVLHNPSLSWIKTVREHLRTIGLESELLNTPGLFLSNRRERGAVFTSWCHNHHLCFANGSSADYFRIDRPFGLYPVIFDNSARRVRWLLALLLSCWRWAFNLRDVPEYCSECDCMINSWHLMFRCKRTEVARITFQNNTGKQFNLENMADESLSDEILRTADSIYRTVVSLDPRAAH
jgi:hypothetical protein